MGSSCILGGANRGITTIDLSTSPEGWGCLLASILVRFRVYIGKSPRGWNESIPMADLCEALVSLKERARVVNFYGGLDQFLLEIQNCFADILSDSEEIVLHVSIRT